MSKVKENGKADPTNRIADVPTASESVVIKPANIICQEFRIHGTSPYVQNKFSNKARAEILAAQQVKPGTNKRKKKIRDPQADYDGAFHKLEDGSNGIPCSAFRNAMISACRVAGFVMTKAKLSIFCEMDGLDDEGMPLVRIIGTPTMHEGYGRLSDGTACLIFRPMWKEWTANVKISFDGDQFTSSDVANLIERAGLQVGVGEGRPDSKKSAGVGWGRFTLLREDTAGN